MDSLFYQCSTLKLIESANIRNPKYIGWHILSIELCRIISIIYQYYILIELANKHPRVNILQPGCGVGGHCIAVDPYFITAEFPMESRMIGQARQINNYKAYYYEALRQSSTGWETNENDYFPFMENFLSTLYMCYKELDKRFAVVHGKKVTKKARIEATVLNSLTPVSKSDICHILPDVSPTTVEAVLGAMVKAGTIRKIGQGRGSIYIAR